MSNSQEISRRSFIQTGITLGSAAGVLVLTGAACDSSKPAAQNNAGGSTAQPAAAGCTDLTGLSDADKQTREQLKYADKSVVTGKSCDNCQLYEAAAAGKTCGACKVVKGPINPKGYCTAWAAKA